MARPPTTVWLAVARALRRQYCLSSLAWSRPLRASHSLSQPWGIRMPEASCSISVDDSTIIHTRRDENDSNCTVVGLSACDVMGRNSLSDSRGRVACSQTDDTDLADNRVASELYTVGHPLRIHPQERQSTQTTPSRQHADHAASHFRDTFSTRICNRTSAASRRTPGPYQARYNLSTVPHHGIAQIIDGRAMAEAIKREVAADVALLRQGIVDASTLENHLPDPAEQEYRRSQHCRSLGIDVTTAHETSGNTTRGEHNRGDDTGSTTSLSTQSLREGVRSPNTSAAMLNSTNSSSSCTSRSSGHSSSRTDSGNHMSSSNQARACNSEPGSPATHHAIHQPAAAATSGSSSSSSSSNNKSLCAVTCASTVPSLAVVLVGRREDSLSYVQMKEAACEETGIATITINLPEGVSEERVVKVVRDLNEDHGTHGVLVQLPLPGHINAENVLSSVSLHKDVDGFHPINVGHLAIAGRQPLFVSCTALAVAELLLRSQLPIRGRHAVVVGRSNVVGIPTALLLQRHDATVTVLYAGSPHPSLICRNADVVVAAAGTPALVTADWLKPGCVVVDVGINAIEDPLCHHGRRIVGDVCFEDACRMASAITPVPGGVGPMTVAMLLKNTVLAAKRAAVAHAH